MPKSPERCQEIREEARSKILHDSMLYFAKNGFAGTKISDLAKHIGIGQGTLYVYFKSKEELYNEIFALTNYSEDIKELKILAHLPISAPKKIRKLSKSIMDNLIQDETYAAKVALNTQMTLEKRGFVSDETMNEIVTERPNLFEPNVYITVCAEIAGKVCPDKLSAAVKQAFEANEAMSKIVLEHGFAYYEKMSVSNCKIEINNENKNWMELVNQNEKIPFAIDKGELIKAFIIPSEDKTQIIIMAHHLVGDGKSIIYFVKDIMNALSDIPLTYKPLTLLERNLPQKRLSVI